MLDDCLLLPPSEDIYLLQLGSFLALCVILGVPIPKKIHSSLLLLFYTCLGIELDSLAFEARLPLDKLTTCQALFGEAL